MRVGQLWHWIYLRGVTDFAAMTNVSKELRATLAGAFALSRPEIVTEQISGDGTRKWLLRFPPRGAGRPVEIETVYIPEEGRGTLCLSSQVGCTLSCTFCHTGTQKLVRNLTAEEIVGQILLARDRLGDYGALRCRGALTSPLRGGRNRTAEISRDGGDEPAPTRLVTNIVMMGMGEPLYNFDNVKQALLIAADGEGIGLSRRRITLSTSGVVPMIPRAGEEIGVMLADLAPRRARRAARRAGAAQQEVPDRRAARRLPRLSRPLQRPAHHLRVRDAEGRQRLARRRPRAGAAARRHPGQDQPDPVQPVAGDAPTSAPTGSRSSASPTSSTAPATPRRSARRAAATSWPPAAS